LAFHPPLVVAPSCTGSNSMSMLEETTWSYERKIH